MDQSYLDCVYTTRVVDINKISTEPRGGGPFGRSFGRSVAGAADDGRRTTDDGRRTRANAAAREDVRARVSRSPRSRVAARCRWTVTM